MDCLGTVSVCSVCPVLPCQPEPEPEDSYHSHHPFVTSCSSADCHDYEEQAIMLMEGYMSAAAWHYQSLMAHAAALHHLQWHIQRSVAGDTAFAYCNDAGSSAFPRLPPPGQWHLAALDNLAPMQREPISHWQTKRFAKVSEEQRQSLN